MVDWDRIVQSPRYAKYIAYAFLALVVAMAMGITKGITFLNLNQIVIPDGITSWIVGIGAALVFWWLYDNYI